MTCTVANVIAYEVCDNCGVPGVVFRDAYLNFANKICAYVSSFRINTSSKLSEHRYEGCSKSESDKKHWNFLNWWNCSGNWRINVKMEAKNQVK